MALSSNIRNDNIEMEPLTTKQIPGALCTTPRPKRPNAKKLQFSTPEFSVTPISTISGNPRLLPSRRRYVIRVLMNEISFDVCTTHHTFSYSNWGIPFCQNLSNRKVYHTFTIKLDRHLIFFSIFFTLFSIRRN